MKRQLTFLFILTQSLALWATHNRAGEIRVEQIGNCGSLKLKATIYTWTKASNTAVDRDTLDLCWGDGFCQKVVRSNGNGNGVTLDNDIKFNVYVAEHTFSGPGSYRISMTDPNRIVGILNVNPPASDNVPFHIETIYTFQDPQFGGCNSTPELLQPPVDDACVGKPFRHNPNAFDPDDDSLSYHLYVPLQSPGLPVPNYLFPTQIAPGGNNLLSIDPIKGDLLWLSPQVAGEYNIAIIIVSWRDGQPIDTTIRDMQIAVKNCTNNPPDVQTITKICVVAGDTISFDALAIDADTMDRVRLTALGGPLSLTYAPASFTVDPGFNDPPVTGKFYWETKCEHITGNPYTVVFKAEDDATVSLIDLATVSIKVVGPPPLDLQAVVTNTEINLSWEKPYICEDALDGYFYGFSVWRREGSNPFLPDTCEPGLAGKGYQQLIIITKEMLNGRYIFKDTTVQPGKTYCYRVLAKFAKISSGGYPYNIVESLPSKEICAQLPRSLPIITRVSVINTDATNGQIDLRWSKPIATDLDTVLNPPPYRYRIFRQSGLNISSPPTGNPIYDQSFNQLWLSDTTFIDQGVNTIATGHAYLIEFSTASSSMPMGYSPSASSVYLSIVSTDQTNKLSWQAKVPWQNQSFDIYMKPPGQIQFDSLTTVQVPQYQHTNLDNGAEYCYYIKTIGTYSIPGVIDPIINLSQEACGVPIDTIAPCSPELSLVNICIDSTISAEPPFFNYLRWTNPNIACLGSNDTYRYNIYFAPDSSTDLTLLATLEGAENTSFDHEVTVTLAGCYSVTAIDTVGNESPKTVRICTDNCPLYALPNVFTPNGDGKNDVFKPFPGYRFVSSIEMQILNRWGNIVFETTNPDINWDGRDQSGKMLSSGTYFYICKAYAQAIDGIIALPGLFSGYIELLGGQ